MIFSGISVIWHMTYRDAIQSYPMTVIHFPEPITIKAGNDACSKHFPLLRELL